MYFIKKQNQQEHQYKNIQKNNTKNTNKRKDMKAATLKLVYN